MRIVGGKLMDVCPCCGKIIRVDKPLFGSLHVCTTDEEQRLYPGQIRARVQEARRKLQEA